tara:strand:+ start:225 stop:527 length:303 start_codon:yes stop_codon:yes gene_type:complete
LRYFFSLKKAEKMKQDLDEVLSCLETLHLTDPALHQERAAELKVLEMFALQTAPALSRTKKNSGRFKTIPAFTPRPLVDKVERRSQNEITSKNLKKTVSA